MVKVQCCVAAGSVGVALWMSASPAGPGNVIETMREVRSSSQFEIDAFATAVEAAGVADVLEGAGPYTIFAPTNEAFEMLGFGSLEPGGSAKTPEEQLQSADKDRLSAVLKQHIVEGRIHSSSS